MIIVPLGVASATPTITRHLPSLALWREGSVFLFDCGENAQMRMLQAGLKRSKIEAVFISHFDVDHYSGLIGLLATFQLQRREKDLTLVGPSGLREYVEWNLKFAQIEPSYAIRYVELKEGFEHEIVLDAKDYQVEAMPLQHNSFCVGFRFQEKDKPGKVDAQKAFELGITQDDEFKELKAGNDVTLPDGSVVLSSDIVGRPRQGDSFAYITDTEYCANSVRLAANVNILFHESTFGENLEEKANTKGHSTATDAARVASEAQAKLLVIGHFSARYTNPFVLLREARKLFFPTWLASELRPIFTDPAHEKGVVTPKVFMKEINMDQDAQGRGHQGGGGQRPFRPRRPFQPRGQGFGGQRQGGGYRQGGYRQQDNRFQDGRGQGYRPRYNNRYEQDDRQGGYEPRYQNPRYQNDGQGPQDRYSQGYDRPRYQRPQDGQDAGYQRRTGYQRDTTYQRDSGYSQREQGDRRAEGGRDSGDAANRGTRHITPRSRYDDFDRF